LRDEFDPSFFFLEQPFSTTNAVHPSSWFITGAVIEAAYSAAGAAANLLTPTQWKRDAGLSGHARKGAILRWAQSLGFPERCGLCVTEGKDKDKCEGSAAHDRADALGVAVAGAVFVAANTSTVQRIVTE
jgi:hypothetical protein